jgi:hypothetical protein
VWLVLVGAAASGCARDGRTQGPGEGPATRLQIVVPEADEDADLYVDGNYVGQVGELADPAVGWPLLAPGLHRVEVRKAGRFPVQTTVDVPKRPPDETSLTAELLADPR